MLPLSLLSDGRKISSSLLQEVGDQEAGYAPLSPVGDSMGEESQRCRFA